MLFLSFPDSTGQLVVSNLVRKFSVKRFSFMILMLLIVSCSKQPSIENFTQQDIEFLKQFSLSSLPAPPHSKGNAYADNSAAANLGKKLFFDTEFSANQQVSCASCHQPQNYFTDQLKFSKAIGTTSRNAPSILTSSWSPWLFWDGRKDSLWSQALAPIENPAEHGISRIEFVKILASKYRSDYESIFGSFIANKNLQALEQTATPLGTDKQLELWQSIDRTTQIAINQIFANAGKALMAYQRKLRLSPAPFDEFIDQLTSNNVADLNLNAKEIEGLRLFVGKGNCASCHNGPLFSNFEFHNIGAPESNINRVDLGRFIGVSELLKDEFTCLSEYSDAKSDDCREMLFLKKQGPELVGAFKTPSLRNIVQTAPYMQQGQFETLLQVVNNYNKPTPPFYDRNQHPNRPHFDILPLKLSELEIENIIAFLNTLTSPFPDNDVWWQAP